ncbi:MAG: hypothetical protein ABJH04_07305 [Cyclobacteriaceae bacterium]
MKASISKKKILFPYILFYKPSFIALYFFSYTFTYVVFVIAGLWVSPFTVTVVFPVLLLISFCLIIYFNNALLNRSSKKLFDTGYYTGAIPVGMILAFSEHIQKAEFDESKLNKYFNNMFPPGIAALRVRDYLMIKDPFLFIMKLIQDGRQNELDQLINFYANEHYNK